MPQTFHIIRCFECEIFQVHIVKKSNKWECKMCGKKQSLKKVFFEGNGKECRLHVQDLNAMRGTKESLASLHNGSEKPPEEQVCMLADPQQSKWIKYMDEDLVDQPDNISDTDGDVKYVLETLPTNKRRKLNSGNIGWKGRKSFKSNKNDNENFSPKNSTVKENKIIEPTSYNEELLRLHSNECNIKDSFSNLKKNPEVFFSDKTDTKILDPVKNKFTSSTNKIFGNKSSNTPVVNVCQPGNSKWDKFLDKTDNIRDEEDSKYSDFSSGGNNLGKSKENQNDVIESTSCVASLTSCHKKNIFSSMDDSNLDEIFEI